MRIKKKYLYKPNKITKNLADGFVRDRRSGIDRRKYSNAKYFLKMALKEGVGKREDIYGT
jgi:hypothetical protein